MKNERQEMILQIIRDHNVETQEELLAYLKDMGVSSTQATISRDIKQLTEAVSSWKSRFLVGRVVNHM